MAGIELEWADVDRRAALDPELGKWSEADYTIVNSDGHANHPTGDWPWGGEINTRPTSTAQEQAGITEALAKQLCPVVNYRCNLHVHVSVPELSWDIERGLAERLKTVARYFRAAEPMVYTVVDPIPNPGRAEYPGDEQFKGAMRRYRRRLVSHQYSLPQARYLELLGASSAQQVLDAHAPPTRAGKRAWHLAPRPGMNLRSLWKHGTIEYRHFPGTAEPSEVESAVAWCLAFTEAAVFTNKEPADIYASRRWCFPEFKPYVHALELGYLATAYRPKSASPVRVHREHQPVRSGTTLVLFDELGDEERGPERRGEPAHEPEDAGAAPAAGRRRRR